MNNVLVLVLSSQSDDYQRLRQVQRETWASVKHPHVKHFFFVGEPDRPESQLIGDTLYLKCPDTYDWMGWKTKLAFDWFKDAPQRFFFRTNATSYVCKRTLFERAQQLPLRGCYSGIAGCPNGEGVAHVDGGGIFLSRDCVETIRNGMQERPDALIDDGEFANLLRDVPIIEGDRWDYFDPRKSEQPLRDTYLYRCRHIPKANTDKTIEALRAVHAFKSQC